ncbi:hypothetical protein M3484_19940 [Pseudomonas sp. GX19020]|uniref:hypothetical protein n=1 Tax=Pseudomonas sp. GX19020 TaxID=2942277 RepID=UPI00201A20D5|nr:hypothetical protein [Pseudomonas sp. GX19020]MCL4068836.1 hypothetical protein [Pseudomonas sp. GX19020]
MALWLADPLVARATFLLEGEAWIVACASAWGRGAVVVIDLRVDPARRADALTTEDELAAQAGPEVSDGAARRLFDGLTSPDLTPPGLAP